MQKKLTLKIINYHENKLLNRIEIKMSLFTLKKNCLNKNHIEELIHKTLPHYTNKHLIVKKIDYKFGGNKTIINCVIYDDINDMHRLETVKILKKNKIIASFSKGKRRILKEKAKKNKLKIGIKRLPRK
mmetsp:Transcript_2573/g.3713  ORF Transcript_2573/g.3713 Transcript_2573/m.3713 type:complete len:129 (+) Transcript_2573:39-425(+)